MFSTDTDKVQVVGVTCLTLKKNHDSDPTEERRVKNAICYLSRSAPHNAHPPAPASIIIQRPGSRCRFPSSVPHCVTEPVKWGPWSYRDTSLMTHGAPLSGRIVPLRQLRNGARVGGGGNQQSTGPHPAPASKGPRQRAAPALPNPPDSKG